MDLETAELWLDAITVGAALFWLASLFFVRYVSKGLRGDGEWTPDHEDSMTVEGDPAELTRTAVKTLAQAAIVSPQMQVNILDVQREALSFDLTIPNGRAPLLKRGVLAFASRGGTRTEARWQLFYRRGGGLLTAAWIVVALGLLVVVGLHLALRLYALPSPDPQVRGQVVQMGQCIHLLWPPFLLAGIALGHRRMVRVGVERFVGRLPQLAGL